MKAFALEYEVICAEKICPLTHSREPTRLKNFKYRKHTTQSMSWVLEFMFQQQKMNKAVNKSYNDKNMSKKCHTDVIVCLYYHSDLVTSSHPRVLAMKT